MLIKDHKISNDTLNIVAHGDGRIEAISSTFSGVCSIMISPADEARLLQFLADRQVCRVDSGTRATFVPFRNGDAIVWDAFEAGPRPGEYRRVYDAPGARENEHVIAYEGGELVVFGHQIRKPD